MYLLLVSLSFLATAVNVGGNSVPCSLSGWWENRENVTLRIVEDVPRGTTIEFAGVYYSGDKASTNVDSHATLRGSRLRTTQPQQNTFGLVVSFPGGSSGIWVGQCYPSPNNAILESVWLFRAPADYPDYWKSTRVGKDVWRKLSDLPEWYKPGSH